MGNRCPYMLVRDTETGNVSAILEDGPSISGTGATELEAVTALLSYCRDLVNERNAQLAQFKDMLLLPSEKRAIKEMFG